VPHQDDEAVGCTGTVIMHVKAGGHVAEVAFCTYDTSERMKKASRAVSIMGFQKNHYMQFPVRTLSGNKNF
jgi:LmbE family N-acetylglucosaminyl deacetylase